VRRRAVVVVAALCIGAATGVAGTDAQAASSIVVTPALADPGGVVRVSNDPSSPCPQTLPTSNASASVDLYTAGSATPVNRMPYQGPVNTSGSWSVEVRLAPDLPPGSYRVQAGCYTDSGLNSAYGPTYGSGRLDVRLQNPGLPTASSRRGKPGDGFQVNSGGARCPPPAGSPSPRVRVSLLDSTRATRAESESAVDATTGDWSVGLRVPEIGSQSAEITAVCLARVGAPSPYARYDAATFAVEADRMPEATTTTTMITAPTTVATLAGATTTPSTAVVATTVPTSLPTTPLAVAVVAEPTYTG